ARLSIAARASVSARAGDPDDRAECERSLRPFGMPVGVAPPCSRVPRPLALRPAPPLDMPLGISVWQAWRPRPPEAPASDGEHADERSQAPCKSSAKLRNWPQLSAAPGHQKGRHVTG